MKKYIKSSSGDKNYIGGKLYDLPDNYWEDDDLHITRSEEQAEYVNKFANYYIIYRPKYSYDTFGLWVSEPTLLYDLTESMAIKDGVDVIAYPDYIEVVAYNGSFRETAYLYPISEEKAAELTSLIDNSDFSESTVIENEIAQYAYGGATIEDVLNSWKNY